MERAAAVLSDCTGMGVEGKSKAGKPEAGFREPEKLKTPSVEQKKPCEECAGG